MKSWSECLKRAKRKHPLLTLARNMSPSHPSKQRVILVNKFPSSSGRLGMCALCGTPKRILANDPSCTKLLGKRRIDAFNSRIGEQTCQATSWVKWSQMVHENAKKQLTSSKDQGDCHQPLLYAGHVVRYNLLAQSLERTTSSFFRRASCTCEKASPGPPDPRSCRFSPHTAKRGYKIETSGEPRASNL